MSDAMTRWVHYRHADGRTAVGTLHGDRIVEHGIVIGRECRDASVDEARRAIFGYTCLNDVTAVDLMNENEDFVQWCRAKGCDTFGCIGPAIATTFDWKSARVVTRVDGAERQ